MKTNKGFIGLGLILVIVLGVAVVGGGAYYIGKNDSKTEKQNPENVLQKNQNQPVAESSSTSVTSKDCGPNSKPSIKVFSPNGGETYNLGQTINIKWDSKCIDSKSLVYLNIGVKDSQAVPELLNGLQVPNTGSYNFKIPSNYTYPYNNKYDLAVTYIYGNGESVGDHSDTSFTINSATSSEESTTESFKKQPGEIKSIKADGANKWILAVDLLTSNPNWVPGVDSSGPFFLNQNPKIRNLNISSSTKINNCGSQNAGYASGFENNLSSFVKRIKGESNYTIYFDISDSNITAIYEQCLP